MEGKQAHLVAVLLDHLQDAGHEVSQLGVVLLLLVLLGGRQPLEDVLHRPPLLNHQSHVLEVGQVDRGGVFGVVAFILRADRGGGGGRRRPLGRDWDVLLQDPGGRRLALGGHLQKGEKGLHCLEILKVLAWPR